MPEQDLASCFIDYDGDHNLSSSSGDCFAIEYPDNASSAAEISTSATTLHGYYYPEGSGVVNKWFTEEARTSANYSTLAYDFRQFDGGTSGGVGDRKKIYVDCEICGRRCRDRNDLIKHNYIHTGEKPFHCSWCDYESRQSSNLITHVRKKHAQHYDQFMESRRTRTRRLVSGGHSLHCPDLPAGAQPATDPLTLP